MLLQCRAPRQGQDVFTIAGETLVALDEVADEDESTKLRKMQGV